MLSSNKSSNENFDNEKEINSSETNANNKLRSFDDKSSKDKLKYNLVSYIKEDHGNSLFSIQIYRPFEQDSENIIFATAGSNRLSIYEYSSSTGNVELIQAFVDADPVEVYYICAWTTDIKTHDSIIAVAGLKGIIRTILPFKKIYKNALFGHGSSINDLRFHPKKSSILLSSSKDYTLRLWNINTSVCIAIFGGVEGHRDEVLSGDFNLNGTMIMSCSIDHFLRMWNLQNTKIIKAIEDSDTFSVNVKSFPTVMVNFPEFATRDVHTNYIDCVRWFGELVLSKSCENCVVLWKPGLLEESVESITRSNKNVSILHKFNLKECDIWYVRFALDFSQKTLALGTQYGKVYIWDLDVEDPNDIKRMILIHPKSKRAIRSIDLSMNGKDLIAVNDEGAIYIWRRE